MNLKINLIFMGGFTYPHGMAATRRIQNIINALKDSSEVETRVIIQRQTPQNNKFSGVHQGTQYEILMGELSRAKVLLALPSLYYKTNAALMRAIKPECDNVLYFYGPIFIDSIGSLYYANKIGYKIIFDVIEDFGLARDVSRTFYQYTRSKLASIISSNIWKLASGIVVISSYLEKQSKLETKGLVPIHYMPISVDMSLFPGRKKKNKSVNKTLFYAGSFSKKDGVLMLLEAFDKLAAKYTGIRLILTGRGDKHAMEELYMRIDESQFRNQIEYKGYLEEYDYYTLLNESDIPCMTRADLAFSHAGFPFKLGEFLATGKPVIASKVSDVERFLTNEINAVLVQAGSSEDIYDAADFILKNDSAAQQIGSKGREVAMTHFNHKIQGQALVSFLKGI